LRGSLAVLALGDRALPRGNDPRLDARELGHEVGGVDHEVALDREVLQRLDAHHPAEIAQERAAAELRRAIIIPQLPQIAAARPAEGERAVEMVLDAATPVAPTSSVKGMVQRCV
jgi:hypothetical protein